MVKQRVGLLWYADDAHVASAVGRGNRLAPLADAFAKEGLDPVPIPYRHRDHPGAERRLADCEAVMVWVNPVEEDRDRGRLDSTLFELEQSGVVVSAGDEGRYALCEINVNSVSPPPGGPVDVVAATLAARLRS